MSSIIIQSGIRYKTTACRRCWTGLTVRPVIRWNSLQKCTKTSTFPSMKFTAGIGTNTFKLNFGLSCVEINNCPQVDPKILYFCLDWIDSRNLINILGRFNNFDRCCILKSNTTQMKSCIRSGQFLAICITVIAEVIIINVLKRIQLSMNSRIDIVTESSI